MSNFIAFEITNATGNVCARIENGTSYSPTRALNCAEVRHGECYGIERGGNRILVTR